MIGGWTTASLPQVKLLNPAPRFDAARGRTNASVEGGALTQVSRLGNPLVNEVVIGLRDKDRFNASRPVHDPQFLSYVTNPALPELLEALFGGLGVRAPNNFPRNDLVAVFLTGIPGLTKPAKLSAPGEMLRLNTGIAPTAGEHAVESRRARRRHGRLPERPPSRRRRRRHRAARGDGRALHAERSGDVRLRSCRCSDGQLAVHRRRHCRCGRLRRGVPVLTTPIAGSPSN